MSRVLNFLRGFLRPKPVAPPQYGTLGRPQEQGEAYSYFHGADLEGFLAGEHGLHLSSSWLESAMYFPDRQELQINFLDGFIAYFGCDRDLALEFARAPSKGRFLHSAAVKLGYNPDGTWIFAVPYRPG